MKSSWEQQLKKQLEESSPEALGFRPDRDKMWNRIAAKQKRKTLPLRLWLSHAAAIAAGLVIGSFFLANYKDHNGAEVKQPPAVAVSPSTPQPEAQAEPIPLPATRPASAGSQQPVKPAAIQAGQHTGLAVQAASQGKIQQEQPPALPASVAQTPEPAPVVARAEQAKPKVLHLMDIDNENTRMMRHPPDQHGVWAWMEPANRAEAEEASFSEQVGRHIFHIKN